MIDSSKSYRMDTDAHFFLLMERPNATRLFCLSSFAGIRKGIIYRHASENAIGEKNA